MSRYRITVEEIWLASDGAPWFSLYGPANIWIGIYPSIGKAMDWLAEWLK